MKPVFLIFALLLLVPFTASAEVPPLLNYQGRLASNGGTPVADGIHRMRFLLWDSPTGGSLLWQEPAAGQPTREIQVVGGVFSVTLGGVVALPVSAFTGSTYLEVEVNGETLAPRQRIVSVAYALRAATADALQGHPVAATSPAPGHIMRWNGTMWAPAAESLLTLPYQGTANDPGPALDITNQGGPAAMLSGDVLMPKGLLGMGIETPLSPLHINTDISTIGRLTSSSTFGTSLNIANTSDTHRSWSITTTGSASGRGAGHLSFFSPSTAVTAMYIERAGNVGVGTTSPGARLDVRGNIKFGPTGQFDAVASGGATRIVSGKISGTGTILAGTGFTVSRGIGFPTGAYTITFDTPFTGIPVVVATPDSLYIAPSAQSTTTWAQVYTTRPSTTSLVDAPFYFIAIGPR
jgi:hypothetical protein